MPTEIQAILDMVTPIILAWVATAKIPSSIKKIITDILNAKKTKEEKDKQFQEALDKIAFLENKVKELSDCDDAIINEIEKGDK